MESIAYKTSAGSLEITPRTIDELKKGQRLLEQLSQIEIAARKTVCALVQTGLPIITKKIRTPALDILRAFKDHPEQVRLDPIQVFSESNSATMRYALENYIATARFDGFSGQVAQVNFSTNNVFGLKTLLLYPTNEESMIRMHDITGGKWQYSLYKDVVTAQNGDTPVPFVFIQSLTVPVTGDQETVGLSRFLYAAPWGTDAEILIN